MCGRVKTADGALDDWKSCVMEVVRLRGIGRRCVAELSSSAGREGRATGGDSGDAMSGGLGESQSWVAQAGNAAVVSGGDTEKGGE